MSGKSTLLKVLSHITDPTEGRAEIRGRVGSLLEVGTGFHSELTGRENIQLSGAIIGMTRAEINSKFDDIVEFSGISRFLDTPVKRYSSGMYVRLAFAVAAHLQTEILIIDEVLAVGEWSSEEMLGRWGKWRWVGGLCSSLAQHERPRTLALDAPAGIGANVQLGCVESGREVYCIRWHFGKLSRCRRCSCRTAAQLGAVAAQVKQEAVLAAVAGGLALLRGRSLASTGVWE
jgi:hypothetical protein